MATDSISLSAVHPEARKHYKRDTSFADLKARVEALGHQLFRKGSGNDTEYFVHDPDPAFDEIICYGNLKDIGDWCATVEESGPWHRELPRERSETRVDAASATAEDTTRFADLRAKESHAVQVWRSELKSDIAKLGITIDGLSARVVTLDANKAPIDDATRTELQALEERLKHLLDGARYEGDRVTVDPATTADTELPADNPIQAFMMATVMLRGCCLCDNDAYHRGRSLVDIMAAQLKHEDDRPTLPLSPAQCGDVLEFICHAQPDVDGEVQWIGITNDAVVAKYRGDPGAGFYRILSHVSEQLHAKTESE